MIVINRVWDFVFWIVRLELFEFMFVMVIFIDLFKNNELDLRCCISWFFFLFVGNIWMIKV